MLVSNATVSRGRAYAAQQHSDSIPEDVQQLTMPSSETLMTFYFATAVFAYMPGPSMLYTAVQTIARGRRAGWMAAIGIHVGGYVHVIAAALGISVLFSVVPFLFSLIKFIGACYLVALGIQLFCKSAGRSQVALDIDSAERSESTFWQSITVEMLNPKTAIFYIAFLPQFTDPAAAIPLWGQLLILGTIVNIMFSSADVICVVLSSSIVKLFNETPTGRQIVQRIGGAILVGLGISLAFTRQ